VLLARYSLAALLCLALPAALAQNPATFNISSSAALTSSINTYTADINNDGVLDLVQDFAPLASGFTVKLGNGDGTFAGYKYTAYNNQSGTGGPLTIGDFNGDGKLDVAASFTNSNLVQVYLGNGDGTFQAPIATTVAFIGGQTFASAPLVTADFNHDGKLDLVLAGTVGETSTVYLLPGNGNGTFGAAIPLISPSLPGSSDHATVYNITTGDFDSNGSADIAFTASNLYSGDPIVTTVYVLYGNGDNTFDSRVAYSDNGQLSLASGDLNGDGYTDLFGLDSTNNRLVTLYSQHDDLTFTPYFAPLPGASSGNQYNYAAGSYAPTLSLADFNNDGLMDLVAYTYNTSSNTSNLVFFLANYDQPGVFTTQEVPLPAYTWNNSPVVGDFNRDTKPDVAIIQSQQYAYGYQALTVALNSTDGGLLWSNCPYPLQGNGLSLCAPTASSGPAPLSFNATSNSFGQIRKIELWVDGTKITEQHNTWGHNGFFDFVSSFPAGQHAATLYEADVDDTLQRLNFNFTVGPSACAAPTSAGVHICSPAGTPTSPINVQATADVTGTLDRMEVWIDGVKKYTFATGSPTLSASIPVAAGTHQVTVYAVNTEGTVWDETVTTTTH
jgi:hypothetical protein